MKHRKKSIHRCLILGWWALVLLSASHAQAATDLSLRHDPPRCAPRNAPIPLTFELVADAQAPQFREVRIYFRIQGAEEFYFIQASPQEQANIYTGVLPAPEADATAVEYLLLVVTQSGESFKSPLYSLLIETDATCSEASISPPPSVIIVFGDHATLPGTGFQGDEIVWTPSEDPRGVRYLGQAQEIPAQGITASADQTSAKPHARSPRFGKKTLIGLGAGLGALAAVGVVALGGEESDEEIWTAVDDTTDAVIAELVKTPQRQTTCGTLVTNQLFVTNNGTTDLAIGTIDYEVILTREDPAGACQPGQIGAFAPNLATTVPPGQTLLIREWSNDVNPCSGCPYLPAECTWESRYIVHTSAGSALAFSFFTAEGNLCGSATTKPGVRGRQIQGDVRP
ncbi:hypothetical protein GF339_06185 [candidate division KSB3 bacterium]|uniref:LTD domain-containing protein n=1 Tax=candidate division KSB3 bacterium TaxID=2044937 RepID=A0A9D5JTV9_9BACT|nr:hypothetical protein [candidate division KSB3 bacterium]MBD3324153.1 hypothetical protein [candidate division KSB3 bacterium]